MTRHASGWTLRFRSLLTALMLGGSAGLLHATTPGLALVTPRGAQRGTEMEAVFHGARLGDAQEILFYETGISVVSLNASNAAQLKVRLKIDPAARLGQHVVRVRTAGGLSEARTFSVGQYPVAEEKEPISALPSDVASMAARPSGAWKRFAPPGWMPTVV